MGGKGSGRIPAPVGLKLLHGTSEGRDSGGRKVKQPPRFTRAAPEAPALLDGDDVALAEWERIVDLLEPLDILSPTHQATLAAYCKAVSEETAAEAILAAEGRVIENPKTGHTHAHPAAAMARAARDQILRYGREFGLTPSAEQRFGEVPGDGDAPNPFATPPPYRRGNNPFG
jgi:P27 family predicted phage terminase small subunit